MQTTSMHPIAARRAIRQGVRSPLSLSLSVKHLSIMLAVIVASALGTAPLAARQWHSPHYQDHPLVGTIWTSGLTQATAEQLETALRNATFVLLGEIHNNADHHRLQAQMIETLVRHARRPSVVMEMVPSSLQAELDRHLQGGSADAGKLGEVLRWKERGWPDWAIYKPIAEVALSANLPILGGALDPHTTRAISKSDPAQAQLILDLKLDRPVRPEIVGALAREIEEAHCNLMPKSSVNPMIMAQRARDAQMAKIMLSASPKDGAVLIAGSGHVRKDWGVPSFVELGSPDASVLSIAFFEALPGRLSPSDYFETVAGSPAPYDFIYFTPKADLTDHCAEMAEHMKKMRPNN